MRSMSSTIYFTRATRAVRYRETRALIPRERMALGVGEARGEPLTVDVVLKSLEFVLSMSLGGSSRTGTVSLGLMSLSLGVSCSLNH